MKERKVGGRSYDVPNLASLCKSYSKKLLFGAADWTRTSNSQSQSLMLHQLNYGGIKKEPLSSRD